MKNSLFALVTFIVITLMIGGCLSSGKEDKYLCNANSKSYMTITNSEGTFESDNYGLEGAVQLVTKITDNNDTVRKTLVDLRMISSADNKAYIIYVEMDSVVTTGAYGMDRVDSAYIYVKDGGPYSIADLNISFSQLSELGNVTLSGVQNYGYSTATFEGKYMVNNDSIAFSGSYCIDIYPED